MDTPRFPSLFFRQRLNAAGIPMLVGVLLFLYLPEAALPLILISAALLFALALFGKGEERTILLWLCLGLALSLMIWGKVGLDQKRLSSLCSESHTVRGYVVEFREEGPVLALSSLDGKPFFRKVLLNGEDSFSCGEKRELTLNFTEVFPENGRADGVDLEAVASDEGKIVGKSHLYTAVGTIRDRLLSRFRSWDEGSFLSAVLLGERGEMKQEIKDAFRRTASSHILAVSGLHISLLVGFLLAFLRRLTLPFWAIRIALFLSVPILFLLAGAGISVFRASVMTLFAAMGLCLKRRADSLTALVFSASLLVFLDPFAPESTSFLLSYLCTFAMVTCAVPLSDWLCERLKDSFSVPVLTNAVKLFLSAMAVSVVLFCFSLPAQLLLFGEIQPLAPLYAPLLVTLFQPCLAAAALVSILSFLPEKATGILLLIPKGYLALLDALADTAPDLWDMGAFRTPLAILSVLPLLVFYCLKCRVTKILWLYLALVLALVGILGISFLFTLT